jgi:hypothetical protein
LQKRAELSLITVSVCTAILVATFAAAFAIL